MGQADKCCRESYAHKPLRKGKQAHAYTGAIFERNNEIRFQLSPPVSHLTLKDELVPTAREVKAGYGKDQESIVAIPGPGQPRPKSHRYSFHVCWTDGALSKEPTREVFKHLAKRLPTLHQ